MWQRLGNIIPELDAIIDKNKINLKAAYILADLSPRDQLTLVKEVGAILTSSSISRYNPKKHSVYDLIELVKSNSNNKIKLVRFSYDSNRIEDADFVPHLVFIRKGQEEKVLSNLETINDIKIVNTKLS